MVAHPDSTRPKSLPLENREAALRLDRLADRLEGRGENPFRVRAYRGAAETLRGLARPAADLLREGGRDRLRTLPGIGPRLSAVIEQLVLTGELPVPDDSNSHPADVLATVAGMGTELARRVHEQLHISTLEELERAAHDGRLATVPGFGPKRVRGVREALAGRFRRPTSGPAAEPPPVEDILAVDAAYRDRAGRGLLRRITPRRFNPSGEAWLPVFRTRRHGRWYRALFSNTALAHKLHREGDWVVIYYGVGGASGQCTVVIATVGPMRGRRVIRGREAECARYYGLPAGGMAADSHDDPRSDG